MLSKRIQDRLTKNLEAEKKDKLTEMIDENVSRITDKFLKEIVTDKIEKINIPTKEDSWSSKVEMVPISEYIGKRFERMATEKNLNERGGEYRRYDKDRKSVV